MITASDVEAIERATLVAVAPDRVVEIGDWLVPLSAGTVGRAKSAAPLRHDIGREAAKLDEIEAAYHDAGLPAAYRVAEAPSLEAIRADLRRRGFHAEQPTDVKITTSAEMAAVNATAASTFPQPPPGWSDVFLGPGFDPIDGNFRVEALTRAQGSAYAAVQREGQTVAVGVASFGYGWASVHGMRTHQAWRGQGLAGEVLAGLAHEALGRGITRVFLQVESGNAPALALYGRAGFRTAWQYNYWRRDG